ncbi:hypothetical protein [Bacteroides gallinarum]|uniref:hypothetical protein n=1 Tax=Bacteroides gallinarum TaxID=376806 RepID=UPI00037CC0D5|nr:hypothetical protein [Bacteroides gallinarum]
MTTDTATRIISKYESLVVLCTYNILFTNDICCGQVIECLHAMKRTPYYRHAFKRYLNDADKARKEYERTVNRVIGTDRSGFFAECNDKYTEEVNKHVEMLYWQFKQVLDNNGIAHSAELARFELARTLCDYACIQFDIGVDELRKKDTRFKGFTLDYLKLANLARMMNLASDSLKISKTVNMNAERWAAFNVLTSKLSDADNIANAIKV